MKRTNEKQRQTQNQEVGIRMTADLKARIHTYQDQLYKTGLQVSFSSAVRALLDQSLKAAGIK